ncbi:glycosyltransferase [Microbacterium sp. MYb62]|uniref:glycosyltransferase n=1 Tax=Microbacterium sp. MYb62 TaxID=1848690 RepID=UPI000CFD2578|nr:glycosyltransferase [Microbacterium sp. MYb62]PRB15146.1 glycosyl transferase [Microbacterium sp. MYb62]
MRHSSDRPMVSVCMAAYNGAAFIVEQITSILAQLGDGDELIVIDDCSHDETAALVQAVGDPRIRLIRAEQNNGYMRTFERAIGLAEGGVVFLSDQDDVWLPGRVDRMVEALESVELVVSNFASFGGALTSVQARRLKAADSSRWMRNIFWIWVGTRPYYGCCMAFRAELRDRILPFPTYLTETHDQWLGYVANADRSVRHLEEDTISRRIHGANSSKTGRGLGAILRARLMTGRAIIEAFRRRVKA